MDDEIGEEFERSGFTFDEEEEILKKYIQSPNPGFLEGNQVISLNEGGSEEEQVSCVCVNPETLAKDEGVLL